MKHTDTGEHTKNKPCHRHLGHDHSHSENCGHKATKHGDHIDYEHDGHIHRVHDGHVDECDGDSITIESETTMKGQSVIYL